jgi:hypothetical protein
MIQMGFSQNNASSYGDNGIKQWRPSTFIQMKVPSI